MQRNLKKLWPTAAASLVAVTSFLSADSDSSQMRNLENRVDALEQKRGGVGGVINPSARPYVRDSVGLFFTGDALIWQARENGLPVGIINNDATTSNLNNSTVQELSYRWNWGFRVGVGYNIQRDGWDLYLNWTRLYSRANLGTQTATSTQLFYPVWLNPASANADNEAGNWNANWRNRLNLLDLTMGREFLTSKWLTLRPNVGIRSAWVRQRYNVNYNNMGAATTFSAVQNTNNYWGLGILAGLDTDWRLGAGFSIYGNAAISVLAGFFNVSQIQDDTVTGTLTRYTNINDKFRIGRAITDLQLGLRWNTDWSDQRYYFMLQVGWEQHIFFGQNQMMRFSDANEFTFSNNLGDLTYQGWTIAARFDF